MTFLRPIALLGAVVILTTPFLCPAQSLLGNYTGYAVSGRTITVDADTAAVQILFYQPDIVRVDFLPSPSTIIDPSLVVIQDTASPVPVSIAETDSTLSFSTSALRVVFTKAPLRISFQTSAGTSLLAESPATGLAAAGPSRRMAFVLSPEDHFYGTGERGTSLDKRGQTFQSYNTQHFGYSQPLSTMNINIPFLASARGYALYIDNTYPGVFDLGASDPGIFSYTASGGELSYYLIEAPTIAQQLERYTWLTGRQPLPPRWALGFIPATRLFSICTGSGRWEIWRGTPRRGHSRQR